MGPKPNLILTAAISAILAGHGAAPAKPCITENLMCPEPEVPPSDMKELEQQNFPTFYGVQTVVLGTATPIRTGSANIVEGPDGAAGSGNTIITPANGAMNMVSAAPQTYQDVQPRIFPSV
jgi:hypothetical protein